MANINKIKVGTLTHDIRPFATCDTAATTKEKVVALDGFVLFTGATILVQFTYANSILLPTLNVNGTGAKSIYTGGTVLPVPHFWAASTIVEFCYDGTYWRLLTTFNSDSDTTNTAGSSNKTGSKLLLVGATSTTTGQTYTNSECYIGTNNRLYSGGVKVLAGAESTSDDDEYPILIKDTPGTDVVGTGTAFNQYVTLNPNTRTLQVGSASSSSYYGKVQAGNGFYQTSDERLKDFGEDVNIDFDALKSIPKKYFTWKDDEEKKSNIGTSAQALQKIYPELVSDSNGTLIVDYNKLSVIALKAVDELHAENQELKDRLTKLEEMVYGNRN